MRRESCLTDVAVWAWPAAHGIVTAIGLISALFSDGGFGDMLAAVCLGLPVGTGLWFGWLCRYRHSTESASR